MEGKGLRQALARCAGSTFLSVAAQRAHSFICWSNAMKRALEMRCITRPARRSLGLASLPFLLGLRSARKSVKVTSGTRRASNSCHAVCFLPPLRSGPVESCPAGGGVWPKYRPRTRRSCKTRAGTSRVHSATLRSRESCPPYPDRRGPRCARLAPCAPQPRAAGCANACRAARGSARPLTSFGLRLALLRLRYVALGRVRKARRSRCPRARPASRAWRCARSPTITSR